MNSSSNGITRRQALAATGIGVGGIALGAGAGVLITRNSSQPEDSTTVRASGQQDQPGYFRYHVGDITVTAVLDGTFPLDTGLVLKGIDERTVDSELRSAFRTNPITSVVNCYVVDTGRSVVLVDTGAGVSLGAGAGRFAANLTASGYRLDDIDEIVITHLHSDHIGGLSVGGEPRFQNARVRLGVGADDLAYWLDADRRAEASTDARPFFDAAASALKPYRVDGRVGGFASGGRVVDGLSAVPLPGHTPGHHGFRVKSGAAELLIWGDVVHVAEVQFERPGVAVSFDVSPEEAVKTRNALYSQVAEKRIAVAGSHLPFPGIGHVVSSDTGFAYVPTEFGATAAG